MLAARLGRPGYYIRCIYHCTCKLDMVGIEMQDRCSVVQLVALAADIHCLFTKDLRDGASVVQKRAHGSIPMSESPSRFNVDWMFEKKLQQIDLVSIVQSKICTANHLKES